ncbi:MAG: hypothetical protein WA045_08525 [Nitrospira sp.]|mgnify:CR=1 FL=1|jgi:hypothetical protein
MNTFRKILFDKWVLDRGVAQRGHGPAMVWKLTALVLLLPVYLWGVCVLTPSSAVEYAEHMAEEGEHYDPYGYHVPPVVEKPQLAGFAEDPSPDFCGSAPLDSLQAHPHLARDHPPPLFYSLSHSLRAPPTLSLA